MSWISRWMGSSLSEWERECATKGLSACPPSHISPQAVDARQCKLVTPRLVCFCPNGSQALSEERLQAISLFFEDYTISSCGPCPGWLHFLPKMYQMSPESSLLHHAVCTAAYANIAQKTERPDLAIMAMSHYRESLEIVKQTLCLPKPALDDQTMTGVMLLGIYECINSTLVEYPQYHHSSGLETLVRILVLLRTRRKQQLMPCRRISEGLS